MLLIMKSHTEGFIASGYFWDSGGQ